MDSMDEPRFVWDILDFLAEARDRMVHRACIRRIWITPNRAKQLVARNDAVRALGEVFQDLEVSMREIDLVCAIGGFQHLEIDGHVTQVEQSHAGARPAQHGVDPREQLFEIERLGDVIVSAKLQPAQLVALLALRRQEYNRGPRIVSPALNEVEATPARQIHIEQDEIWCERFRD